MCIYPCTHALIYYLYSMNHPTLQLSRFRNHIIDVPGFKQVFFSRSQFPSQFWPRVAALCHFFTFSVFNSYLQTKLKRTSQSLCHCSMLFCPQETIWGTRQKPQLSLTLAQIHLIQGVLLSKMKNPPLHTLRVWLVKRLAPL